MNAHPRQGIPFRADPRAVQREALTLFLRVVILESLGALKDAGNLAERRSAWRDDRALDLIVRAPSMTTSTADASVLIQTAVALVKALVPVSAAFALFEQALRVTFGSNGAITLPLISPAPVTFIGENQPLPMWRRRPRRDLHCGRKKWRACPV